MGKQVWHVKQLFHHDVHPNRDMGLILFGSHEILTKYI